MSAETRRRTSPTKGGLSGVPGRQTAPAKVWKEDGREMEERRETDRGEREGRQEEDGKEMEGLQMIF